MLPGGFFQQGRSGQIAKAEFTITLAGQSSATTAIFTAGIATAANSTGSTLVAANAITCTSFSAGIVHGEVLISNWGSGYGTSSVATNLQSTMDVRFNNGSTAQPSSTGGGVALGGPTQLATIDFSVNQWFYLTVTFSTSSTSNSATLKQLVMYGPNLPARFAFSNWYSILRICARKSKLPADTPIAGTAEMVCAIPVMSTPGRKLIPMLTLATTGSRIIQNVPSTFTVVLR